MVRSRTSRSTSLSAHTDRDPLAKHRVGDAAGILQLLNEVAGGRSLAPQRTLPRKRDPLVGERHLGERPSLTRAPDQMPRAQVHVVEEHFVEGVIAGHVDDGSHGHAFGVHRADEIGDA